ncbi:hypothetical protein U2I54_02840 [Bacillus pseudomycoides]|uniref:Uncharacterized protein n=1 Tax=Bacillus bingmayongensis TaxID=1150157 RepID=A0ABU5JRM4_9BACI|nr:hypothetical protein [Bacillus pseudomycoides]
MSVETWYRYTFREKYFSMALPNTWTLMETDPKYIEKFTSIFLAEQAEVFPHIAENLEEIKRQLEFLLKNLKGMKVELFALQGLVDEENIIHFADVTVSKFSYAKEYSSIRNIEKLLKEKEESELVSIEEVKFQIGNVIHIREYTTVEMENEDIKACTNQFLIPLSKENDI